MLSFVTGGLLIHIVTPPDVAVPMLVSKKVVENAKSSFDAINPSMQQSIEVPGVWF